MNESFDPSKALKNTFTPDTVEKPPAREIQRDIDANGEVEFVDDDVEEDD